MNGYCKHLLSTFNDNKGVHGIFTTSKNTAAVFLEKSVISICCVQLAVFYSPLAKLHQLHL